MIRARNLTITYPNKKGIKNISFNVEEGTVMGYLGPNGAGKTTTIRGLMGFVKPNKGNCTINSRDCFINAPSINRMLGYIPGEIVFPPGFTCSEFIKYQKKLRGLKNDDYVNSLIERFELFADGDIKHFSKGMKQKLGIVVAFMHDPRVLILDEPTSGLDPLMQSEFISLIKEEKTKGKTILLSSHIFEEIEKTCDNVLIIKDGNLIAEDDVAALVKNKKKVFLVKTREIEKLMSFDELDTRLTDYNQVEISATENDIDHIIKKLSSLYIDSFEIKTQSLEDIFMHYYERNENNG